MTVSVLSSEAAPAADLTAGQRQARAVGAFLGLAIGDALGATVEFMTPAEIAHANRRRGGRHTEIVGGGWLRLRAGQVTDDTTMALALGEAILEAHGRIEASACARAFDGWMRGRPVDIGNTVRRGILHFRNTGAVHVPESQDAGNGAAMRCLPVALALAGSTPARLDAAALVQARVTHHNPLSDAVVCALVRMVSALVCGAGPEVLLKEAASLSEVHPELRFRGRQCLNPSGYVVDTYRAVMQALVDTADFEACLVEVVNRGGDADTTGAIAGMLAGALYGESALPERWLVALDPAVRASCESQARRLFAHAPAATLSRARH
ncbi:MAG: ADP-ribosyl-[dinitrogen reductase] hydrolase [Rhodocyclaceae bacterium]|nr:ADP-ribosyl-[dinitrogen reductase] hydrolase [Rhodocyclaceae bacterium]